jgi:hypothetical protein
VFSSALIRLDKIFKVWYNSDSGNANKNEEDKFIITVVDSPCGSGKTMWAIDYINSLSGENRILFITPFLSECERIKQSCPLKNFISPDVKSGRGRKMDSLISLIGSGKNIVSTHALFANLNSDLLNKIQAKNYVLIIDEAMEILRKVNVYADVRNMSEEDGEKKTYEDVQTLIEKNIISISNSGEVIWNDNLVLNKYEYIKQRSKMNSLILVNGELLMWTFPNKIFEDKFFKDIYILTYQFDYQLQSYYFKYYNIEYKKKEINVVDNKYNIVKYDVGAKDVEYRKVARGLIEICNVEKLNSVGSHSIDLSNNTPATALSISWYKKNPDGVDMIRKNIINYFKTVTKSSGDERMWTSFKSYQSKVKSVLASNKNFIAINARATNSFANKKYLTYTINRYLHPSFLHFFSQRDIYVDQDKFALSELIQWIWRSAIRNGEKIYIYIPSERMRGLLQNWLDI